MDHECSVCGRDDQPLRKGRCDACRKYHNRTGEDRPIDLICRANDRMLAA